MKDEPFIRDQVASGGRWQVAAGGRNPGSSGIVVVLLEL
jgi:hypothetical protein